MTSFINNAANNSKETTVDIFAAIATLSQLRILISTPKMIHGMFANEMSQIVHNTAQTEYKLALRELQDVQLSNQPARELALAATHFKSAAEYYDQARKRWRLGVESVIIGERRASYSLWKLHRGSYMSWAMVATIYKRLENKELLAKYVGEYYKAFGHYHFSLAFTDAYTQENLEGRTKYREEYQTASKLALSLGYEFDIRRYVLYYLPDKVRSRFPYKEIYL